MYDSLITNIPKEIMAINEDNPFPAHLPSFIGHSDVFDYLVEFSQKHDLEKYIRFGTEVVECSQMDDVDKEANQYPKWKVAYKPTGSADSAICQLVFDFVLVCSGHFEVPYQPSILNIDTFQGSVTHARDYDRPDKFRGSRVLVVGSRSSGTDIARELVAAGCEVHVADRSRGQKSKSTASTDNDASHNLAESINTGSNHDLNKNEPFPGSLFHHSSIRRIVPNSKRVEFEDDSVADVDIVMFCTGYYYHFPFLKSLTLSTNTPCTSTSFHRPDSVISWQGSSIADVGSRIVPELYRQLFYIPNPTLAFIGLPYAIFPFFFFHIQMLLVSRVFLSQIQLPSTTDMYESVGMFEQSIRDRDLYLREPRTASGQLETIISSSSVSCMSSESPKSSTSGERLMASTAAQDVSVQAKLDRNYHYLGGDLQIDYLKSIVNLCGYTNTISVTDKERLLQYIELLRQIYDDVSMNRPAYVGASDHYRRRNYMVDKSTLLWSVLQTKKLH